MLDNARLVWMDLEMTGLDPEKESIIQIGTVVTDAKLEIIEVGPELVIHQGDTLLDHMDEWNTEHHGSSGLTAAVKASKTSMRDAEQATLNFIKKYVEEKQSPLCGNSIHQDRRFMNRYMHELNEYLHYRNIDVSSIKEIAKHWYPDLPQMEKKKGHTAMDDILESIEELKYYRERIFLEKFRLM